MDAKIKGIQAWVQVAGAIALAIGITAGFSDGKTRSTALLLLLVVSLVLAVLASRPVAGQARPSQLDGLAYEAPDAASVRVIHFIATILYNVGIAVVVLAGVVRTGVLEIGFAQPVIDAFPIILGAYVLLLALATRFRISEQGGTYANWYTRYHGIFLAVVAVPILAIAMALINNPEVLVGPVLVSERDLLVLILVGVLGVGTQLFLSLRLPNVIDLLTQGVQRMFKTGEQQGTPPLVYVMVISLAGTAILGWLLLQFDIVGALGTQFADARITFLILLLPLGLTIFFATSTAAIWREARRGLYRHKMSTKLRNDIIVYGLSATFGLFFGGMLIGAISGRPALGPLAFNERTVMDLTMLTIVSTVGPIGFYIQRELKRINEIEARLADFLNDLADSRRAGLPLATGLQNAGLSDYGALSVEVDRMARQVAWGVSFNDALERMGKRVRSSLVRRAVTLVIEASHTGGSVADILKAAAKDAYEIKSLEADRRVAMLTYLIVIYVVFFVFMVVIAILQIRFIPQIVSAAQATGQSDLSSAFSLSEIDPRALGQIYFNATMVQAMGNGIVGGILSEGRIMSGFRHIAIMALAGWAIFRFVLPGI